MRCILHGVPIYQRYATRSSIDKKIIVNTKLPFEDVEAVLAGKGTVFCVDESKGVRW